MRHGLGAAVLLLALCGHGAAAPAPHRVMSLKLCTDALLMELAPANRIASVTYLSQEKAALARWPIAAKLAVNHNTPEEVLAARPDLILTDTFTSPAMRAVLARTGAPIVEVPEAQDWAGIRANVRLVAGALGTKARGEKLIAAMDRELARLPKPGRPIRVAGWGEGGYLPGGSGLWSAIVTAAGGVDIAGGSGVYYDLEQLLAARPDILLYGDQYAGLPSLRDEQDAHPALMRFFAQRRVSYPSALLACGLPDSAAAAVQLRTAMQAAMARPGGVP